MKNKDDLDEDSSGSEMGNDREKIQDEEEKQKLQKNLKSKMCDDWNYLKSTLKGGKGFGNVN